MYTRQQLIDANAAEYEWLCQEDFDPDVDMTQSQYVEHLQSLSVDELITETGCDSHYPLSDFIANWS